MKTLLLPGDDCQLSELRSKVNPDLSGGCFQRLSLSSVALTRPLHPSHPQPPNTSAQRTVDERADERGAGVVALRSVELVELAGDEGVKLLDGGPWARLHPPSTLPSLLSLSSFWVFLSV